MKKVVKKTLIYGGSAAVLGGAVAGITVAVLNAKKEVHKAKTFGEGKQVSTHQNIEDLESHSEEGGKKERKLLDKVKYHLSFKLYEEEQKGSFEFQKADFKFQMYEKAKEAVQQMVDNQKIGITSLTNGNQTYDKDFVNNPLKINEVEKDFDKFIEWAKKEVDNAIKKPTGSTKKTKDENISKAKKLKNKLDDLKEEHSKIKDKLDNVNNSKIDFNESSVSSNYPLLLLPIKIIREKQEKILSDAKESFISSPTFKTKEEGQAAWPQNLIDKYSGATSEKEAVDLLVSNETQSNAFKRYRYKINNNFTVEKIVTGIYNDIFNIKTDFKTNKNVLDKSSIVDNINSKIITKPKSNSATNTITLFANKDFTNSTDLNKSLQEKVYFLGTESLVINSNNKNYFAPNLNDADMKKYIESLIGTKIAKVENAIIGLTPNSSDNQAAWQYGSQIKDKRQAIRNALKLFVGGDNQNPKYLTGYNNANEIFGKDNDLSKNLISQITATQDSSKYKGGDYGWKSQLDNVKGMTAGFGVGLIGAFRDMTEDNLITTSLDGTSFSDKMNSVKRIYKAIFDGLNDFIQAKGGTQLKDYSSSTPLVSDIEKYNRTLQTFTDEKILSDDDILKYIGSSVRKEINNTTKLFLNKSGNNTSTLPPIIDIGVDKSNGANEGHVYIFTTEEYGMHLVRVNKGKSILNKIKEDMVKVANKQDTKEANTDYVSLLNNALTTNKQLEDLLGLTKNQSGKPELSKNKYTDQIDTDFKNGDFKEYKDGKTSADLKEDIAWLIESLKTADIFSKLKQSIPKSYSDWLTKLVDNKVMLEPKDSGLAPEDIYNWALKEEEEK